MKLKKKKYVLRNEIRTHVCGTINAQLFNTTWNRKSAIVRSAPLGINCVRVFSTSFTIAKQTVGTTRKPCARTTTAAMYPNQMDTAAAVMGAFQEGVAWVVLQAPMQSGKSATYMFAAAELLRLGHIEQFIVISGTADVDLKQQTENPEEFWSAYQKYLITNAIGGAGPDGENYRVDVIVRLKAQFAVIWGTNLKKYRRAHTNTLFIWDESHYAQSKGQLPEQFFHLQKISPNGDGGGTTNRVLSVSATPFSETIDVSKHGQEKRVIHMTVSADYYGVDRMLADDVVRLFDETDLEERVLEITARADGRNVGLIRTVKPKIEHEVKALAAQHGVECVEMNSNTEVKNIDEIMDQYDAPVIVLIKGMLRMGKRIAAKNRLVWCIETAIHANHDTILQGLLGRCCGYVQSGSGPEIMNYLPPMPLANLREWGGLVAGKAMNVTSPQRSKKNSGYATVPYLLELPLDAEMLNSKEELICAMRDFFDTPTWVEDETKDDLRRVLRERSLVTSNTGSSKASVEFRDLRSSTYQNVCGGEGLEEQMLRHIRNNTPLKIPKHSCGCVLGQVMVWHNGFPVAGDELWRVILQYKTATGSNEVGETTGNEIFNMKYDEGAEDQQNGGASFKLEPNTAHDIGEMKRAIESMVVWAREFSAGEVNPCVVPPTEFTSERSGNSDEFNGIIVSEEVYTSLKPGGSIYEELKQEQDVVLELTHSKGRVPQGLPEGYKRLASIKWI